jgi:hypothetical protein
MMKARPSDKGGFVAIGPSRKGQEERRREARAEVSIGASLRLAGREYLGIVCDLSVAGAYVELIDRERVALEGSGELAADGLGAPIAFAIRGARRGADGLVRGLGVEFLGVPADQRERIAVVVQAYQAPGS